MLNCVKEESLISEIGRNDKFFFLHFGGFGLDLSFARCHDLLLSFKLTHSISK